MDFLYKYRKVIFVVILLLCVAAGIYSVNRTNPTFAENTFGFVITPVQGFITNVSSWFGSKFNVITHISEIEEENKTLKVQLAAKEEEIHRLNLISDENEKLTKLLSTSTKYSDYPKLTANIIAKDPGNWYNLFTIDKGTNDGIEKNMAVISSGGLVGRVMECGFNYSKVISIIDDTDSVSAKSIRTDDIGFVKGDLSKRGTCRMEYIDNDAEIIEGDEIITSHLSEIYPPGITIGYVTDVEDDKSSLSKYASIETAVDFKHLETVFVITEKFEKNYTEE
ncbi:MAG: rod shape-determining protein MreC [Firmicutes bacterium]|nr:rod shape-determining protein MreC [Bacillota bacterium]